MPQKKKKKESSVLEKQLKKANREGVSLYLDGQEASPREIANVHAVNEESIYMMDYVWSDAGSLAEMHFDKVKNV